MKARFPQGSQALSSRTRRRKYLTSISFYLFKVSGLWRRRRRNPVIRSQNRPRKLSGDDLSTVVSLRGHGLMSLQFYLDGLKVCFFPNNETGTNLGSLSIACLGEYTLLLAEIIPN
jgi:hypothetical protein